MKNLDTSLSMIDTINQIRQPLKNALLGAKVLQNLEKNGKLLIYGWVFHDLTLGVNKYGTNTKEASENSSTSRINYVIIVLELKFLESPLILRIFYVAVQKGCFFGVGTIFINPYFQIIGNSSRNSS